MKPNASRSPSPADVMPDDLPVAAMSENARIVLAKRYLKKDDTGTPVEEPAFEKGQEYEVAPAKDVRPVPKFSRRAQLAPLLASSDNPFFKRNAANRFWAQLMGRGLVEPVEDCERGRPSHPELLHSGSRLLGGTRIIRWSRSTCTTSPILVIGTSGSMGEWSDRRGMAWCGPRRVIKRCMT